MYLVILNESNTIKFDNQFTAFEIIQKLWAENKSLKIQMISIDTGFVHDLSWLKHKTI